MKISINSTSPVPKISKVSDGSNNEKGFDVKDSKLSIGACTKIVEGDTEECKKAEIASLIIDFIKKCYEQDQLRLIWDVNNCINVSKLKKWLEHKKVKSDLIKILLPGFIVTKQVNQLPYSNINKTMIINISDQGNSDTAVASENRLSDDFYYQSCFNIPYKTMKLLYKDVPVFVKPKIFYCHINSNHTAMLVIKELDYNQSGESSAILDQFIREASTYLAGRSHRPSYDLVQLIIDTRWRTSELNDDGSNEVRLINCIYRLTQSSSEAGVWKALAFVCMFYYRKNIEALFDENNKFIIDKFYTWFEINSHYTEIGKYFNIDYVKSISLSEDKKTVRFGDDYYTTIKNVGSVFEVQTNKEQLLELEASEKFCEYIFEYSNYNNIHDLFGPSRVFNNQMTEFNDWLMLASKSQLEIVEFREYSKNIKIAQFTDGKIIITFGKYVKMEFIATEEIVKKYVERFNLDKDSKAGYTKFAPEFYSYLNKDKVGSSSIKYLEMAANQLMVDLGYSKEKLTIKSALLKENDPIFKVFLGLSLVLAKYKYKTLNNKEYFADDLIKWCKNNDVWEYLAQKANFLECETILPPEKSKNIDEYINSGHLPILINKWNIKASWLSRYKESFLDGYSVQDSDAESFLGAYKEVLLQINKPNQLKTLPDSSYMQYNLKPEDNGSEWLDLGKVSGRGSIKEMRGNRALNLVIKPYFEANASSNLYEFLTAKSYPEIVDIITSYDIKRGCEFWVETFWKSSSPNPNDEHLYSICHYLMITKFIIGILKTNPDFQGAKIYYLTYLTEAFKICPIVFNNSEIRKKIFQQFSLLQRRSLIEKIHKICREDPKLRLYLKYYKFVEDKDQLIPINTKILKQDSITICDNDLNQIDPVLWFQTNLLPQLSNKDDDSDKKHNDLVSELDYANDSILQIFRKAMELIFLDDYAENWFEYNVDRMTDLVNYIIVSSPDYKQVGLLVEEYVNAVLNLTLYRGRKGRDAIKPINKINAFEKLSEYCCNAMNESNVEKGKIIEAIFICMNKNREVENKADDIDNELAALVKDNVFTQITEKRNFFSNAKMPTGAYFALATIYISDKGLHAINPPSFKFPVAGFKSWLSKYNNKYFEVDDDLAFLEEKIKIIQLSPVKYQVKFNSTNGTFWNGGVNYADIPELYVVLLDDLIIYEMSAYGVPKTGFERHEMAHRIMRVSFGQEIPVPYAEKHTSKFNSPIFTYRENMLFDYDIRKTLYNTLFTRIQAESVILSVHPEDEVKIMN